MEGWRELRLGDVYSFSSGLSKPRSEFGFGFPFLSFKEVFNNYFVPSVLENLANTTEKERNTCSIKRGDVFLTRTSETPEELGMSSVALSNFPDATFNGFTKRLRPKAKEEICPEFVGYYFRSPKFRAVMGGMSSETTRASLNNAMMKDLILVLPPVSEQQAIAAVLSSLDDKIDLLHRQNKTLEALAQTLFRQWFVEEADEGWKEVQLGDFFKVITGKKDANFSTEDGKYPFFTCSQKTLCAPDYSFEGSAILLAGNGDFNIKRYSGKFEAYQRTYVLIPTSKEYYNFLYIAMKAFLLDITEGHRGSVINFITKGMIENYQIVFPKEGYGAKFCTFDKIYDRVDKNQTQIHTLTKLRDTLLPKLMSGEVRVLCN